MRSGSSRGGRADSARSIGRNSAQGRTRRSCASAIGVEIARIGGSAPGHALFRDTPCERSGNSSCERSCRAPTFRAHVTFADDHEFRYDRPAIRSAAPRPRARARVRCRAVRAAAADDRASLGLDQVDGSRMNQRTVMQHRTDRLIAGSAGSAGTEAGVEQVCQVDDVWASASSLVFAFMPWSAVKPPRRQVGPGGQDNRPSSRRTGLPLQHRERWFGCT